MNEALFQFIWKYSLYQPLNLQTAAGEPITIIFPGMLNKDAGPDFSEARIKIGNTTLIGNIELHINSSDWLKHGHQQDNAYQHLILHVVYNNDVKDIGNDIPVLELAGNIPQYVIHQYTDLQQAQAKLPCNTQHTSVREITKESWLNRLIAERWEQKLGEWKQQLKQSTDDWRHLLYWRMAYNFGFKINSVPFMLMAQSLPLNILAKHGNNLLQIEALLFGQAGMLSAEFKDDYPKQLQQEYNYLKQKYKLEPVETHLWKFLRMRPANFPTVRIAQFAALIYKSANLFSQLVEAATIQEIEELLNATAGEYWDKHFTFDEPQDAPSKKRLGKSSIQNIIINTIAPIQFLFAGGHGTQAQQEKALQLLDALPAEKNNILSVWNDHGWEAKNATQSQALIQLYNNYCTSKRCLECTIGLNVIKPR